MEKKDRYISIGEMAKINRTTVPTLRLYDSMGLLTPYYTDGTTAYEEADLIFVCRKLYAQEMKPECFTVDGPDEKWYPGKDYHTMYMGEIVKVLVRE